MSCPFPARLGIRVDFRFSSHFTNRKHDSYLCATVTASDNETNDHETTAMTMKTSGGSGDDDDDDGDGGELPHSRIIYNSLEYRQVVLGQRQYFVATFGIWVCFFSHYFPFFFFVFFCLLACLLRTDGTNCVINDRPPTFHSYRFNPLSCGIRCLIEHWITFFNATQKKPPHKNEECGPQCAVINDRFYGCPLDGHVLTPSHIQSRLWILFFLLSWFLSCLLV